MEYATIEVLFKTEPKTKHIKMAVMVLLTTYLGRRTSKIKIGDIPLEVVAAIMSVLEDKITILQSQAMELQNGQGQRTRNDYTSSPC